MEPLGLAVEAPPGFFVNGDIEDDPDGWDDPGKAEAWWTQLRPSVEAYLRREGVHHGRIGEVPAWYVAPHVSLWAIESASQPGSLGWWVICGDVPTDYCSAKDCRHPRLALRRIAQTWRAALDESSPSGQTIGETGLSATLRPLLAARVNLLMAAADDDSHWPTVAYG